MTTMGRHSPPIDGTVTANGHPLAPFTIGQSLTGRPRGPVSAWTAADKAGRRRADGLMFIVVALLNAAMVAVVAFSGSWQHQYELSIHLGQARWVAGMQPLSVEGLIVAATLVIWFAARYKHGIPWGAYLVLAAGIGQTVLMNLGADYRWPWLGPEISVWPAVAFVAAYEMAVWLVRKRQDGGSDDARADATATGDTTPAATARRDKRDKLRADKAAVVAARLKIETDRMRQPSPRDKAAAAKRGLSVEEEAARDGVSPGAVRKRRERARKAAAGRSTT